MAYLVSITPRAERDMADLYEHIGAERSNSAMDWYTGLKRAILSLETYPNRSPVTHETRALRHLLYGHKPHVYRVIYRVLEKQQRVEILHIRHGRREEFQSSELG